MELLFSGLETICDPIVILWIIFGVFLGVIFGALPGVSATMSIVLCVSFTYAMSPVVAIAFLSAVYCASITGGGITAILFKIPGTPSSAATVLDGYPMVERGEAGKALGFSLVGSAFGGLISCIIMFLLTQPLMRLALKFNSAEQFAVCVLGLSILVFIDSKHKVNTFLSALIGLAIGCIGIDKLTSVPRLTFGSSDLYGGVGDLPFMLGMFAAAEIFGNIAQPPDRSAYAKDKQAKITKMPGIKEFFALKWTAVRSAVLGTFIGIVPGAGATIASWLSYSVESKLSKTPEKMGHGDPHGIIASETANNAATGGAMVPMLSMGIPGSGAAAMMMTALAIHGVQMGPMLLKAQPTYLSATFVSMMAANILMVFVALFIAKIFARVLSVPYHILGTLIMLLALTGCYAFQSSTFDVLLMVVGGIFGYYFHKFGFNNTALILGLVLGADTEYYFRRAMQMARGNFFNFFSRPLFCVLFAIFAVIWGYALIKSVLAKKSAKAN